MSPRLYLPGAMLVLVLALAGSLNGAEPIVDAAQLPRVPPTPPERALSTFRIKPGFRLELVAAEPLVIDPIALSFDEDGRLYVVEMRDYSERRPERLGRIRRLEDSDGDDRLERSVVFAQDLPWPTAVICYAGGVFVGSTPDILWMKDTNGDGVADVREVIFTGFAADFAPFATNKLNVQALMNSFNWSLDNRIHGATSFSGGRVRAVESAFVENWRRAGGPNGAASRTRALEKQADGAVELRGRDFSFDPRRLEMRAESGGGQHGLSFDQEGRKFVCANSSHLQAVMYEERYTAAHASFTMPRALVEIAVDGGAAPVFRLSPDEPWRVIRTQWRVAGLVPGPVEGGGRPSGYFTGATGVTIYRGDAYGPEFVGDAFVGDAGGNLVHRKKVMKDGVGLKGVRPSDEQGVEFLASTDNWFRPVQFANAPDGCLYICDMYREVIEHPWSLPDSIKRHLDLNSGNDKGRIYRVVTERFQQPRIERLSQAGSARLVERLGNANGWTRDTASRLIFERQDSTEVVALRRMVADGSKPLGSLHALAALRGLGALSLETVVAGLTNPGSAVRREALRFSEPFLRKDSNCIPANVWNQLSDDPELEVRFQAAMTIGVTRPPGRLEWLQNILSTDGWRLGPVRASRGATNAVDDPWVMAAVVQALGDDVGAMFASVAPSLRWASAAEARRLAGALAGLIGRRNRTTEVTDLLRYVWETFRQVGTGDHLNINGFNEAIEVANGLADGLRQAGTSLGAVDKGGRMTNAFKWARILAVSTSERDNVRIPAIRLLGHDPAYSPSGERLIGLLLPNEQSGLIPEAEIQQAAIEALSGTVWPELALALLSRWPRLTPATRGLVADLLLKRAERTRTLLAAMQQGTVKPGELTPAQQAILREHRDARIRQMATEVLGRAASTNRQSVIDAYQPVLGLMGSTARGRTIFQARCATCHRLGTDGYVLGPDLVTVRNAGREKLLVNVLDPNREMNANFTSYAIETTDGESLVGILAGENRASVTMRMAGGIETVVARARIASLQTQGRSLMPEGLEEGLSQQEMADLLEFVLTGP